MLKFQVLVQKKTTRKYKCLVKITCFPLWFCHLNVKFCFVSWRHYSILILTGQVWFFGTIASVDLRNLWLYWLSLFVVFFRYIVYSVFRLSVKWYITDQIQNFYVCSMLLLLFFLLFFFSFRPVSLAYGLVSQMESMAMDFAI